MNVTLYEAGEYREESQFSNNSEKNLTSVSTDFLLREFSSETKTSHINAKFPEQY